MKILYLTPGCFDKGGISRYNRFQISALRQLVGDDNVHVHSLLPRSNHDLEGAFDVAWAPGTTRHFMNKVLFSCRSMATALSWRPDIVWCGHVNISPMSNALAGMVGATSVLNTYGLEVWSGLSRLRARGLRQSNEVISDCLFTARYLESHGFRRTGTVKVAWDAVDVHRFCPGKPAHSVLAKYGIPLDGGGLNVLTLGRMTKDADHKGYRRLLEAFSKASRENRNLRLVYGGGGDLVEVLRKRAAELGVVGRVHFTGFIHDDDLPDVYRSADIFSLVSDRGHGRGEGVPVTPIEAASCGRPIIVGNQDGSPEAVQDGRNGYVIDSLDVEQHARVITQLAHDAQMRTRMGAAGRELASTHFSFERFAQMHSEFLGSIAHR
jgi:phosphatidylinositol alpha-1,6-mannosyltransferase